MKKKVVKIMPLTSQAEIKVVTLEYNSKVNLIFPHIKTLQNTLKDMRQIIKCQYVTCTQIDIDGKNYDVWSDDEALMIDKPIPTLYINDDLVLFGNLIFATSDNEGATTGLTEEDMDRILKFINHQTPKLIAWLNKLIEQQELRKNYVPNKECG